MCRHAKSLQSCPALFHSTGRIPLGSSVHGILQARILDELPRPPPGDFPDPGIKLASLTSPALAGGFLITRATWEAQYICVCVCVFSNIYIYNIIYIYIQQSQVILEINNTGREKITDGNAIQSIMLR